MQQTQVITFGIDGVLADRLRELAETRRFRLRETSQYAACRNLVQMAPPSVLVLTLGRDLERELVLLDEVHTCMPATETIVIGETDNPVLAGLAWDLGATVVLFPPTPLEGITEIIDRLLTTATT